MSARRWVWIAVLSAGCGSSVSLGGESGGAGTSGLAGASSAGAPGAGSGGSSFGGSGGTGFGGSGGTGFGGSGGATNTSTCCMSDASGCAPVPGHCWLDSQCPGMQWCTGVSLCQCGYACPEASPGTCGPPWDTTCNPATWPTAPWADDAGGADVERVWAVKTLDISGKDLDHVGFDLDGVCTTGNPPLDQGSCYNLGAYPEHDFTDGRDNALGDLLESLSGTYQYPPPALDATSPITTGRGTTLIRIRNWNGLPNDRQVELSVYVAAPLDALGLPDDRVTPHWDGADRWPVDTASLETDGVTPKFVDAHAYVANNMFVARIAEADLRLLMNIGPSYVSEQELDLFDSVLVGRIQKDSDGHDVVYDGQIAGRVTSWSLIQQLDEWSSCAPSWLAGMRGAICSHIDLGDPGAGPNSPCTSLSFGVPFTAVQATLGAPYDLGPIPHKCPVDKVPPNDCFATAP